MKDVPIKKCPAKPYVSFRYGTHTKYQAYIAASITTEKDTSAVFLDSEFVLSSTGIRRIVNTVAAEILARHPNKPSRK
jgi:hypothetical protein